MKIKVLLVPLMMMSCLLGSCTPEGEFIEISEYANVVSKEGPGYFEYNETTTRDYECVVQNIFNKYISNLTATKADVFPEGQCDYVSLALNGDYKDYSYFTITVYSEGILSTYCSGSKASQQSSYSIDEQIAKSLIKEVKDRYDEINRIVQESEDAAIEEHNIDKFFIAAEHLEKKSFKYTHRIYDNKGSVEQSYNYTINDNDGSLTSELKDVGYRYMPAHKSRRTDYCIQYKINDSWYFELFNTDYYIAVVHYLYSNPFYETEVKMAYDIDDRTKVDTLVDKIYKSVSE